jgi:tetratricopeptide (TPR) repeat protein
VDSTVIGATVGGVATVIGALITIWGTLHQRKPKPEPSPTKPPVGNYGSPSSNASDLNERGNSSYKQGRYQEALNYYQQALVILREVGDRAGEGTTLNNIGGIYQDRGQYDQALENYQQAPGKFKLAAPGSSLRRLPRAG